MAGLTLAAASAVSHDLYASVIAKGRASEQQRGPHFEALGFGVIGILAIFLGYIFENINVAFMVGLAFAVAASVNFPVLLMSIFWRGTTTLGAFVGGMLGLISRRLWRGAQQSRLGQTLGYKEAIFPYDNPALFSMPIAFIGIWLFSKLDSTKRAQREEQAFDAQFVRSETGIGAATANVH